MKSILVLILVCVFFISGCGDNEQNENPEVVVPSTAPVKDGRPVTSTKPITSTKSDKSEILNSPEFIKYKDAFNNKYSGFTSLPVETLYQIDMAVEKQNNSWSCGLVQANVAKASAAVMLEEALNSSNLRCNVVGDYPLLMELPEKTFGPIIQKLVVKYPKLKDIEFKKEEGSNEAYFRVGALPSELAKYLNEKLENTGVKAKYLSKSSLDKEELLKVVDNTLKIGMPTIVLYVNKPGELGSHYYSIVGYEKNSNKLLVMNTEGIDRIKDFEINEFIAHMNTLNYKNILSSIANEISDPFLLNLLNLLKISDPNKQINELGVFNLIVFNK